MLILNDCHISANRSGGTTPDSQQALRNYLRESLNNLLLTEDEEVTINGDLLDSFSVDIAEVVKAYEIFAEWLGVGQRRKLNLVQGNHDSNPRGAKLSSFHFLCHFLVAHFDHQVRVFDEGFSSIQPNIFCIPHMPNQSLFDLEIEKALDIKGLMPNSYLLLHCNYKNGFAENSDASLNLSDDQVGKLMIAGYVLVLGHEHVGYELRGGRVIVVGNQFPSSVSDCIGDPDKNALIIDGNGHRYVQTWEAFGSYAEIDWKELAAGTAAPDDHQFIRITGDATALESADVIKCISALRQRHSAFVIGNAVRVEGHSMVSDMTEQSVEDIKAFDVLAAIYENLTPEETAAVKGLLA